MSKDLSLREALDRREPVQGIDRARSGIPVSLLLWTTGDIRAPVSVAKELIRHGLTPRQAHRVLNRLAAGETVAREIPNVEMLEGFLEKLKKFGVLAACPSTPQEIDVKRIRKRQGLSQKEFAIRYCIDLNTLKNWEQGRNSPDAPARILLKIIDENPEAVESVLF